MLHAITGVQWVEADGAKFGLPDFRCKAVVGRRSLLESRKPLSDRFWTGLPGMQRLLRPGGLSIRQQEFSLASITTGENTRAGAPCPVCGRASRRRYKSDSQLLQLLMDLRGWSRKRVPRASRSGQATNGSCASTEAKGGESMRTE